MKALTDIVQDIQKQREENLPTQNSINNLSDKIVAEDKLTPSNRVLLLANYINYLLFSLQIALII